MPISDRYTAGRLSGALFSAVPMLIAALWALFFPAVPCGLGADGSPILTPEEVAGVSMSEIDGLSEMSSEYAVSPNGTPLPATEGDDWIPDLSLNSQTAAETVHSEVIAKTASQTPNPPSPDGENFLSAPPNRLPEEYPDGIAPDSAAPAPKNDPENRIISDIRCSEGMEMPISRFNSLIKTKIGNPFNQQVLEEDKRRLLQTKQYVDVVVSTTLIPDEPDKVIVNFDFTPLRKIKYIKVIGNRKMSKTEILEELNMKRGETRMDPYDVENGRIRIAELYKSKNLNEPYIEILVGDRPTDVGVVYLINEGIKQRVRETTFIGNSLVSSARLKSLVSEKPGFLYLIGGEFSRERLDEDVTKLLEYYRSLGCFDAKVDREFEVGEQFKFFNQTNEWITVKYIIDEGPRYKIRNFLFEGNRVIPTEELRAKLKVKPGSEYNFNDLEADRIALKYAYGERGYVLADIQRTQIFTEDEGMIDLRYDIKEDYRYRVKDIQIRYEGEESRTKASVVMNMLEFAPGQVLNDRKIKSSENNLKRSGYFNDKPNEGPLPTVSIIPDTENLYFSKSDAKGPETFHRIDRTARRSGEKPAAEKEGGSGGTPKEPEEKKILGQMPESASVWNPLKRSGDSRHVVSAGYASGGAAPAAAAFDPGFRVLSVEESAAENAANFTAAPDATVRGQTMQVPTGFGGTTTRQSAASAWNGGDYVGYQGSNATSANTYGDTSMYNNGTYSTADTAVPMAPPLSTGIYSSTTTGTAAPGFAAAGRDSVFPGTTEQQGLDSRLWGDYTTGEEPIRDATVVASIMEGRTGMFQASIGVNSNYGLVGNVSFTERNFDMFKLPTALFRPDGWTDAFRGGGQIFRAEASPGRYYSRYSVSWDIPYIFDTNYNFGVTGLYADRYYDNWDDSRFGGELRFGRQWTPRFSTTVNAGAYNIKIHNPRVSFVPDINDVLGRNSQYLVGLNGCYDTRNHPYLPSEGFVIDGGAEYIFGSYRYPRVSIDGRTYFTVHRRVDGSGRMVLGLRSAAGWTGDDTPIYDRYFGGGYQNLRGFEYREVTPRFQNTNVGIGGNFEFYNSAELLVPVSGGDEFMLAFFVDTGIVTESISHWDTYRVAPGIGMRISVPMLGPAPLALDFAFPVVKNDTDEKEIFSFSIQGSR
ncbi:MAG: BamA/TamA family outer membrane protein [Thermoguttaceae bacterium]|nr:BamA/TamA family outer membrane protein [Thermoguttaceae bacterium]